MKYRGVIFDLDGVIVTTDDCHYRAWKRIADEEGIPFDRAVNERLRGVSRMASLEIVLERAVKPYTGAEKQELAHRKNDCYLTLIQALTPDDLLPGALDFVRRVKALGCKTAIGSSSKNAPAILARIGLTGFFDAVADGNDITRSKPDPEVFLRAAQKLGLPSGVCLVVEDADAGIAAGRAAGMATLGVGFAQNCPLADYHAAGLSGEAFARVFDAKRP